MTTLPDAETQLESEEWARHFARHVRGLRLTRRMLRHLPHDPRCKFCLAPFAGPGGAVSTALGRRPSRKNPHMCDVCLEKGPPGGFETEAGVLFADVRGFTSFAETRAPREVAEAMDSFYAAATSVLVAHDAVIDKLVGDEVMALFWPVLMRGRPCEEMVAAAEELLRAVGYGNGDGTPLPLGVGIDFGRLHIGNVGPIGMQDFTALGDVVNTAARLQSEARPGEVVLARRVYEALEEPPPARTLRLVLKGKAEPVEAHVLEVR